MKRQMPAVILILWSIGLGAWADTQQEIDHLLGFIGSSQCTFVRNGEERDSASARSHIEKKYDYARRWIDTTDQFIEYTATKSSISGEPYRVICAGREEPSADWLKRELARFRAGSAR
jgi:hypothetical protein